MVLSYRTLTVSAMRDGLRDLLSIPKEKADADAVSPGPDLPSRMTITNNNNIINHGCDPWKKQYDRDSFSPTGTGPIRPAGSLPVATFLFWIGH
jgi:hypothetical protein